MTNSTPPNSDHDKSDLVESEPGSYQYTKELLDQLSREVHALKEENNNLRQRNEELREQVRQLREGQTDLFSSLSEKQRLAYRHRIKQLLNKIDQHLGESS